MEEAIPVTKMTSQQRFVNDLAGIIAEEIDRHSTTKAPADRPSINFCTVPIHFQGAKVEVIQLNAHAARIQVESLGGVNFQIDVSVW